MIQDLGVKNILYIDTSNNKEIVVGLESGRKKTTLKREANRRTQGVLPMIDTLLKKYRFNLHDLTEIEVNTGPGSFTGLRIGVAIANTLGLVLCIPINGKKIGETVEPMYKD